MKATSKQIKQAEAFASKYWTKYMDGGLHPEWNRLYLEKLNQLVFSIDKVELFEFLEELERDEKEQLEECRCSGDMNSSASGMAYGALDTIRKIKDWVSEVN